MEKPPLDELAERVARLERENGRIVQTHRRYARLGATIAGYAILMTVGGVLGFLKPMAAQTGLAVGPAPRAPDVAPEIPPNDPVPIFPRLSIKDIETEEFGLRDQAGNCLAVLSARDGTPTLCLNAKDQRSRLWFCVSKDGEPSLVFFDRNGKAPVELVVSRDGEPRVSVRRYTPPPARPIGPPVPPAPVQ